MKQKQTKCVPVFVYVCVCVFVLVAKNLQILFAISFNDSQIEYNIYSYVFGFLCTCMCMCVHVCASLLDTYTIKCLYCLCSYERLSAFHYYTVLLLSCCCCCCFFSIHFIAFSLSLSLFLAVSLHSSSIPLGSYVCKELCTKKMIKKRRKYAYIQYK